MERQKKSYIKQIIKDIKYKFFKKAKQLIQDKGGWKYVANQSQDC